MSDRSQPDIDALILDTIASLVVVLGPDREVVRFNRAAEQVSGYTLAEVRAAGIVELLVPPEERDRLLGMFAEVLASGAPVEVEYDWIVRGGGRRRIAWRTAVRRGADGRVELIVAAGVDVTERRRAESAEREAVAALQASEARFRRVFESELLGLVFSNVDGRLVDANDAFLRMIGYTRDELRAGLEWPQLTPPEYASVDERVVRQLVETGRCDPFEKEYFRKDGTRVPVLIAAAAYDASSGVGTGFVLDISDRRRAERALIDANAALRASDARLRQMFESNAVGMAVCHVEGLVVEANESFLRLTGYSRDDLAAGRIDWPSLTPPEYAPLDHAARDTLMTRGACEPYEKEYVRKDGSRVPVLIAGFAYDPLTGNCPTFVLDLSDRRRAEEGERVALRQLRMALETARMAVWEWDPLTDVSAVAGDMTETYGMPAPPANELLNYVHPDDRDAVTSTVRRALADGGPCEVEFRAVRPDGQTRWVRDVCRRRAAAGRATLAGVSVDVTDRKEAELKLRESERRFRQMIENSPDSMFYQDPDLRIVWVSKLGAPYTLADVIGQTDEIFLGRTEHLRLAEIKRRVMATGVGERVETVGHIEGRGVMYFEVALERWQDADGRLRGIAGYSRDITDRKRVERQTVALNETLERRVAERTAQLVDANADLRRLADHNRRLAREVEHRVRNNLASLLALVDVMSHRAPDVETFSRAMASRLTAMAHVHRLLAESAWRPIDLAALVASSLDAMRHLAPHANPVDARGPAVLLPARHALPLTMVLVEWFTNSCKYGAHSAPGGRVDLTWELLVDDNGPAAPGDDRVAADPEDDASANGEAAGRPDDACGASCPRVRLRWTETGGPTVRAPGPPSIGTDLVRGFVRRELAGSCRLEYPPEGARLELEFCPRRARDDQTPVGGGDERAAP